MVDISSRLFMLLCLGLSVALLLIGRAVSLPVGLLGLEVLGTVIGLFVFSSTRYRLDKNALTFGAGLLVLATFCGLESSTFHREIAADGWGPFVAHRLLTFHGLDEMFHADTMLFIFGLTLFVSVIAQTRLLESMTLFMLRCHNGRVLPTLLGVTACVAVSSGVLDGVSMIGLTIRTAVIVLFMAAIPIESVRFTVMLCTCVTTICGAWLAYGEPPNLIMKANLHPALSDLFFLMYCAPGAIASFAVIAWHLRKRLSNAVIEMDKLDLLDRQIAAVRFFQASRHGRVFTPIDLVERSAKLLGDEKTEGLLVRLRRGEPLGKAMIMERVESGSRRMLLADYVSADIAEDLDKYYEIATDTSFFPDSVRQVQGRLVEGCVEEKLSSLRDVHRSAQRFGALGLLPFMAFLVLHGVYHGTVPLFLASFAGFVVANIGVRRVPYVRSLVWEEAWHEFREYLFLIPLFLSISLLSAGGFFSALSELLSEGIDLFGVMAMAMAQFFGATFLSALLDNNVVADFASRALHGMSLGMLQLFASAQIFGYALGGCWTHIGSAQSVLAYAFIQRELDERFTPLDWVKEITPVIVQTTLVLCVVIALEGWFFGY